MYRPTEPNDLSRLIVKYATEGKLQCFRKVEESEYKILCWEYEMNGGKSPDCGQWVKPGDFISSHIVRMDDSLYGDRAPSSAKAALRMMAESCDIGDIPDCIECESLTQVAWLHADLDRWIQNHSFPQASRKVSALGYISVQDLFEREDMTFVEDSNIFDDDGTFEKWSQPLWENWKSIALCTALKRGKQQGHDADWNDIDQRMKGLQNTFRINQWQASVLTGLSNHELALSQVEMLLSLFEDYKARIQRQRRYDSEGPLRIPEAVVGQLTYVRDLLINNNKGGE